MKKLEQYLLFFFVGMHVWEIRNTNRIVSLWLVQLFFFLKNNSDLKNYIIMSEYFYKLRFY